jgi:hypothetical protein
MEELVELAAESSGKMNLISADNCHQPGSFSAHCYSKLDTKAVLTAIVMEERERQAMVSLSCHNEAALRSILFAKILDLWMDRF